ncbi:MAG TPA: hypothetical protein DC054_14405 [Blastocatellia bacterium]|nr:hypothetical protein [Blastocatellia bacterium]
MNQDFQEKFVLLVEQRDGDDDFLSEVIARLEWLRKELAVLKIELLPQPFLSTSQPQQWWHDWVESQYGQAQLNLWQDRPSTFWQYASSCLQTKQIKGIVILGRHYPAELKAEARDLLRAARASRVLYLSLDEATIAQQSEAGTLIPFDDRWAIVRRLAAMTSTHGRAGSTSGNVAASQADPKLQVGKRYRSWPPVDVHPEGSIENRAGGPDDSRATEPPNSDSAPGTTESESVPVEPLKDWTEVRLGVSTPSQLSPGDEFVARFAAYTPVFKEEVERIFKEEAPSSRPRLDLESSKWKKGARVTVGLRATHVQIDNPVQTFDWNGEKNILRFDAKVLPDASGRVLILKFDIAVEGLSLLMLRPEIQLSAAPGSASPPSVLTEKPAPRTAFASYATADRFEVLSRIRSIQIVTGIDVFVDNLSIRPGDQWKATLESEIRKRDAFWLFWSQNAEKSPWVDWEWRTALASKTIDGILPQPLEPADVAPPPQELSALQFGAAYEWYLSSLRKK